MAVLTEIWRERIETWTADVLHVLYPHLCICCEREVPVKGGIFCISCAYHLSLSADFKQGDNDFTRHFWGRIPLYSGAAMFPFVKGGRAQHLIHKIKYEGRKDAAHLLGHWVASVLADHPLFEGVRAVVPVPLHPHRERQRGYNQSAVFGAGIAEKLEIPLHRSALRRCVHTESQTGKSRVQRIENLSQAIQAAPDSSLHGSWVLLVDDVMTTGATLEACALAIQDMGVERISMLTIARGS